MNKIIIVLVIVIAALGGTFWIGRKSVVTNNKGEAVSSRVILNAIQDQAFLVTKTLFLDEEVTITLADPGGWKGFFTGNQLTARALVRTDVGVDLQKLTESDIKVDDANKKITVRLSEADILTSALFGKLEVKNTRGIWTSIKDFFTKEEGEDYNRAVRELIQNGEAAARARSEIFDAARADTGKLIAWLASQMAPSYQVEIIR